MVKLHDHELSVLDSTSQATITASLFQARSSVVEHYLDTVGVVGSIPIAPTNFANEINGLRRTSLSPFAFAPLNRWVLPQIAPLTL